MAMNDILKDVSMAHRIVVKVGTSTLTYEHGTMNLKLIDRLSMVLSDLRNQGKEIILVSSGAQGIALGKLGLAEKPKDTKGKQAIAAVGQCELMYLYDKMFSGYNNTVAQVLLTREDIAIPRRKRNIQNTVTSIGSFAFSYCRYLHTIGIPESVTYIGDKAFYNCSNLTTTIGNGWVKSDGTEVEPATLLKDITYAINRA